MTVRQYTSRFVELSRFDPYLIPTKLLKSKQFEGGLTPKIKDALLALKLKNLWILKIEH